MKRKRSAFQDVNWGLLFSKYDEDSSGYIDPKEFTFLIRDLISARDLSREVSVEETLAVSKRVAAKFSGSLTSITQRQLSEAAINGSFEEERFDPSLFQLLSGEGADHQNQSGRGSTDGGALEVQKLRQIVKVAMKRCKDRSSQKPQSSNSSIGSEIESSDYGRCSICFESIPIPEMWGGRNATFVKNCACDITVCLSCLRAYARSQIVNKEKLTCPSMLSANRRCQMPIDQLLIAQLFKNICPLCENEETSDNPFTTTGCIQDIYHTFCVSCLRKSASEAETQSNPPRCPRYAECRHELEEAVMRKVFQGVLTDDQIEAGLEGWHIRRISRLLTTWRLNNLCFVYIIYCV